MKAATGLNEVEDAIKADSCSLVEIARADGGKDIAIGILTMLLTNLNGFLNVGHNLQSAQIHETANMLLDDEHTKHLKPEDYKVMFNKIKKGLYGPLYDKLDGQTIFQVAYQYCVEKENYFETQHANRKETEKENIEKAAGIKVGNGERRVIDMLKEVAEKMTAENRAKKINTDIEKWERKKSQQEKTAGGIFAEFDELWAQAPAHSSGMAGRFIQYNGKIISQSEYYEIRVKQLQELKE